MTGYEALHSHAAYIDLSKRGKLKLTGEDRARLLHAMSTNDIEHLAVESGIYAFFLAAQGRIIADANIYKSGESLFLDTEPEAAELLAAHLDKYIIADDVTIENQTADWTCFAIEGPNSVAVVEGAGIPIPDALRSIRKFGNGFVARIASAATDGLRVFMPAVDTQPYLDIPKATPDETRAVRLENKIPRFTEDLTDRNLVHETQQLHGVHFSKGCYIGQEIVERVRSQGKVRRLLTSITVAGSIAPLPGTKISVHEKEVGEITSAAFSPALHQVVAFAYLRGEGLLSDAALNVTVDSVPQQASIRL